MKQCPRCKLKTFIVSIFGSICSNCLYDPKFDDEEYVGIGGLGAQLGE